jgi:hypothetical protein
MVSMSRVTHQTIKLTKGKHSSPEDGACVMELASMLAGESFSDHPASVCPVIGSFLRAYNDSIDDEQRQDLYAYAAQAVGTRAGLAVQRERAARMTAWAAAHEQRRWTRFLPFSQLGTLGLRRQPSVHAIGTYAVHAIPKHTDDTHAQVLALLDALLAVGDRRSSLPIERPGSIEQRRGVQPTAA